MGPCLEEHPDSCPTDDLMAGKSSGRGWSRLRNWVTRGKISSGYGTRRGISEEEASRLGREG